MLLQKMDKLKPYRVIKESSDRTFIFGDIIWVSQNGDINNMNANGWITPSEVDDNTLDFEVKNADDFEVLIIGKQEICSRIPR